MNDYDWGIYGSFQGWILGQCLILFVCFWIGWGISTLRRKLRDWKWERVQRYHDKVVEKERKENEQRIKEVDKLLVEARQNAENHKY